MTTLDQLTSTAVTIAPIPQPFLDRVRSEGIDDLGQPVKRLVAAGGEPCRDVLRRAKPGEELILASFTPFSKPGPYKEFGPVFVLANASSETVQRNALPPAGSPTDYLREQFVVRAYSPEEEIVDAVMVSAPALEETVDRLFLSKGTAFLHVRFPTYGCFAMRLDRVHGVA
ncbi:MAG: hypothetical protein QOC81_4878 [Thermoanaerobaculia bacterium]|jgi:hypothetical protein|nr:hypothetical protein [Thermoanaerobaculia bacterium]